MPSLYLLDRMYYFLRSLTDMIPRAIIFLPIPLSSYILVSPYISFFFVNQISSQWLTFVLVRKQ
jgi:hypothetical protein